MDLLILLIRNRDELLTRAQIVEKLWGSDHHFESEQAVNTAVRKIRLALGDNTEARRFVETVVGKGYRFVAPVEVESAPDTAFKAQSVPQSEPIVPPPASSRGRRGAWVVVAAIAALLVTGGFFLRRTGQNLPYSKIVIAVLPFENLSGDPQQEYFSDGITEEVITQLGRTNPARLGVIARTSAMQYKHPHKSIRQIGNELGAAYLIEGSIRTDGDRLRVTVQLIKSEDETHLWADEFDRDVKDVLQMQQEIAGEVARKIQVAIPAGATLQAKKSVNPEAYREYLRGSNLWSRRDNASVLRAMEHFNNAIELDRSFAAPYAGLADSYELLEYFWYMSPKEAYPKALAAGTKALQLDPESADAHVSMAYIRNHYEWNWAEGEAELQRALQADPNHVLAHQWYSYFLIETGRPRAAVAEARKAAELDPLNRGAINALANRLHANGEYREALKQRLLVIELDPTSAPQYDALVFCYRHLGQISEAAKAREKMLELNGDQSLLDLFRRMLKEKGFDAAETATEVETARHRLAELDLSAKEGKYASPSLYAISYAAIGDRERMYQALERAYDDHATVMIELHLDTAFIPYRKESRFQEFLRRVGVPNMADRDLPISESRTQPS